MNEDNNKQIDDDDSVDYLSDDDFFDNIDNETALAAMGKGMLPPELQVLHGSCLIGEGGSDFVAEKLIKALKLLNDDEKNEAMNVAETENNSSFEIFRGAIQDSLNKIAGFVFFTDFILQSNKQIEWSERLLPIYEQYINEIEGRQEVKILKMNPSSLSLHMSRKRQSYLKILLFMLKLRLIKAEKIRRSGKTKQASNLAEDIYKTICHYGSTLLQEIDDRKLRDESIKVRSGFKNTLCLNLHRRNIPYLKLTYHGYLCRQSNYCHHHSA